MRIKDIIEKLNFKIVSGKDKVSREIRSGYCGDLLSDVMGNAPRGCVWITIQTHPNIVAVAVLKEMAGIIISSNYEPDQETIEKADEEEIPIILSGFSSFLIAGKLYELGIR